MFGLTLNEHLSHTGRPRSLVIDVCIHLLYANALSEEGLFRIPGSSIKIKNLKNAINAWFVTLASPNELAHDVQSSVNGVCSPSVLAIYNLFKHVVSRKPQVVSLMGGGDNGQSTAITMGRDDPSPLATCNNQQPVFDVHSIAGLLKLYLRELPEPLFTHALYDRLIEVTVKTMKNEYSQLSLDQLISKLPKTNYENLRLLIRFLHLMTCHCEQNKMTATNLAITMAPSLIWAKPHSMNDIQEPNNEQNLDETQILSMQMSSVGMSASLHAMVIENLINNAENLFPGSVQFSLPELLNYEELLLSNSSKQDRGQKSTSPTGLSTASSSSFSSTSSKGKHSRKGGSMEGLVNDNNNIILNKRPQFTSTRPISMNFSSQKKDASSNIIGQKPPSVPPAPTSRSHLRNTCDQLTHRTFSSHQKPPAPPPPPTPSTLLRRAKHHQLQGQNNDMSDDDQTTTINITNRLSLLSSNTSLNATRPNVPPPDRPSNPKPLANHETVDMSQTPINQDLVNDNERVSSVNDNRSLETPSDIDLRTDFETTSADDDIDISVSVSTSGTSQDNDFNDESSFENESPSLDNQRTQSDGTEDIDDKRLARVEKDKKASNIKEQSADMLVAVPQDPNLSGQDKKASESETGNKSLETLKPPLKPPRSGSPKVTQSTPL